MKVEVVPTGKPVGAEILGVDPNSLLEPEVIKTVVAALDEYGVIFVRNQFTEHAMQVEFSRRLGPLRKPRMNADALVPGFPDLTCLSNIYENGKPIGVVEAGQFWHTDRCFVREPNAYAVLVAEEIPVDNGVVLGGTMFASAAHAYATLAPSLQEQLLSLKASHNFLNPFRKQALSAELAKVLWEEQGDPDVVHPVVRTHPRTSRKCLYVNETYTVGIEGMEQAEGRRLIDSLCRHVSRPEVVFTHTWQPGDLLVWDDCAVQHHAIADYALPLRRKLRRTGVSGTVPV